MSFLDAIKRKLLNHTSISGLPLWALLMILTAFFVLLVVVVVCLYFICRSRRKSYKDNYLCFPNPVPRKPHHYDSFRMSSLDRRLLPRNIYDVEMSSGRPSEGRLVMSGRWSTASWRNEPHYIVTDDLESVARYLPGPKDVRRGSRFSLREIEMATNCFAKENMIGSGEFGVIYHGVLLDNTRVAVKKLLAGSCQAEDFVAEVEAFGQVRHKNLVKMFGYCIEGTYRMIVYEYVDSGDLYQWLHGSPEVSKPLTWGSRVNIIRGIAKGLAYLHEDLEPNVIHGCLKSSNIMLDHQWNPKITDFGIAKLFDPGWGHVSMETLGYFPDSPSTEPFTEENDVYSFGILVMEIISGLMPMDSRQSEPYLTEWFKSLIATQKIAYVVDPKLPELPSLKEVKRIVLVALRCVDPNINHRPKMRDVVHMLEQCDMLLNDDDRFSGETSSHDHPDDSLAVVPVVDGPNRTSEGESSRKRLPSIE